MCHFITLIAPTGDADAVLALTARHGRGAAPIDNPSVRSVLRDGERQYLTTRGHCDCGTVLAPRHPTPDAFEEKLAKQAARMERKGWSAAKISRAIEDRRNIRPDFVTVHSTQAERAFGSHLAAAGFFLGPGLRRDERIWEARRGRGLRRGARQKNPALGA